MATFDLTPDPKVLIALTHTPITPLDALSELTDNALDSVEEARTRGLDIGSPLVVISLPRQSELSRSAGELSVRDNGLGMDLDTAEKALRAGYSGNNPFDHLGLFGMGFNISTGKLGRRTTLLTAKRDAKEAIEVVVDLDEILKNRSYQVPVRTIPKPQGFQNGTIVTVSRWWPDGTANSQFVRKLVQYGTPTIRRELGRRYATILRNFSDNATKRVRMLVADEECQPFEHCVWGDNRFVEHRKVGAVPAVYRFNKVISSQVRCTSCNSLLTDPSQSCSECGSHASRTIDERVRGWVGIQRFDDSTEFGIDLIRNGRAIRIFEKQAFFEHVDDLKRTIKDYPIDQQYGRIVGEVHMDHAPVDFLKQDFQRSSTEWQNAMTYIRGTSSLQPNKPGAEENSSPLYKLYQGYRRVRDIGRKDLYMGYWDPVSNRPTRISRETERELYSKFKNRLPGFYDDAEWWKHVEVADTKPLEELVDCQNCGSQNLPGAEICAACSEVLISKLCINSDCSKKIRISADICPHCSTEQIEVNIRTPWSCAVCGFKNSAHATECSQCSSVYGSPDPLSAESLLTTSIRTDEFSIPACTVKLADGTNSNALAVEVWLCTKPLEQFGAQLRMPMVCFKDPSKLLIFVDALHPCLQSFDLHIEELVASEIADYIYSSNTRLSGSYPLAHSRSNLAWQVMDTYYRENLEDSNDTLRADIKGFFQTIIDHLPDIMSVEASDIVSNLDVNVEKRIVEALQNANEDLSKFGEMKSNGQILRFLDPPVVIELFKQYPSRFFNGAIWQTEFKIPRDIREELGQQILRRVMQSHLNCLEDLAGHIERTSPTSVQRRRARLSLRILLEKMEV